MKKVKNAKGITLISLVVIIAVMLILVFTVTNHMPELQTVSEYTNLEVDIAKLKESVTKFYSNEKSLPILNRYENVTMLQSIKNPNDNDRYFVIDIDKLDIIAKDLNYGRQGYEASKAISIATPITAEHGITDVYIMNEQSHTIYYPQGVEVNGSKAYRMNEVFTEVGDREVVDGVVIPQGFFIVTDSPRRKQDGIVISDVEGDYLDNRRNGNQFVWIPTTSYETTDFDSSGKTYTSYIDSQTQIENQEIEESIQKYGGFFLGRFEAGKDENGNLVEKLGKTPYTNVTLENATTLARNMYKKDDTRYEATSTLVYGKQWDSVMNFVKDRVNITDSSLWGNYSNHEYETAKANGTLTTNSTPSSKTQATASAFQPVAQRDIITGGIDIYMETDKQEIITKALKNEAVRIKVNNEGAEAFIRLTASINVYDQNNNPIYLEKPSIWIGNKERERTEGGETIIEENNTITIYEIFDTISKNEAFDYGNINFITCQNTTNAPIKMEIGITIDALQKEGLTSNDMKGMWGIDANFETGKITNIANYYDNFKGNHYTFQPLLQLQEKYKAQLVWLEDRDENIITVTVLPNTLRKTAESDKWQINNIYDLAGNAEEWTIEKDSDNKYITRGGLCYNNGSQGYASKRTQKEQTQQEDTLGFRVALYLK